MKASRILSRLRCTQPPARPHRARKSLFRFFYYGESEISPVGRPQFRRAAMVKNKRGVGDHPTPRDWLAIGSQGIKPRPSCCEIDQPGQTERPVQAPRV